jgi:hypothetical protein
LFVEAVKIYEKILNEDPNKTRSARNPRDTPFEGILTFFWAYHPVRVFSR